MYTLKWKDKFILPQRREGAKKKMKNGMMYKSATQGCCYGM